MVETKRLPVNRRQGIVLSAVGFATNKFEEMISWVGGVNLNEGDRSVIEAELESKGLLIKVGNEFKLTPEGKDLQTRVEIAFLKED